MRKASREDPENNAAAKGKRSYQRKVRRLTQDIQKIDELFYGRADDPELIYSMLEHKRDDVIRGIVLQLHTAIEDLLDIWLKSQLFGVPVEERVQYARNHRASSRALDDLLDGGRAISFGHKLSLLLGLGKLRRPTFKKLIELNGLRNKCSHNWLLNERIRKRVKPHFPKKPLLQFEGRDLYNIDTLDKFTSEYGGLYLRLFDRIYS